MASSDSNSSVNKRRVICFAAALPRLAFQETSKQPRPALLTLDYTSQLQIDKCDSCAAVPVRCS